MSFDFFNTSYLAFGAKITKAFRSLATMLDDASKSLEYLKYQAAYLDQFINKNYKVSAPYSGDSPVRCKELYDILSIKPISNVSISIVEGSETSSETAKTYGISVSCNVFSPNDYKITKLSGEITDLTKGNVYANLSKRFSVFTGSLEFLSDKEELSISGYNNYSIVGSTKVKLFSYEVVPEEGIIIITNINPSISILPGSYDRTYSKVTLKDVTSTIGNKALDSRKFLIAVTKSYTNSTIQVNVQYNGNSSDSIVYKATQTAGSDNSFTQGVPLYLNAGDILKTTNLDKIYEVIYE